MRARHSRWSGAVLALCAVWLLHARPARANGAFPDEFSIHFQPGAPHRILLGANFGLLISEDDGATWRYTCEPWVVSSSNAALSNTSVSFYQVTAEGVLLADALTVTRSEDDACTWPTATGVAARDESHRPVPGPERRDVRPGDRRGAQSHQRQQLHRRLA